jgi:hypothetical protein
MSKVYILLFFLFSFTLKLKAQDISFKKEYHNFKSDTSIEIAVPFKNKLFCLKSNSQIIVIRLKDNLIDASYTDNSKELKLTNLYLKNDTLIGISQTRNKTKSYYLNDKFIWTALKNPFNAPPIFEDDRYIVTSSCSGEWGGSIYFLDKKTNKKYESIAACVVNVVKVDDSYNVTAALAHMSGFGNVFDVANPLLLTKYNRDYLKGKKTIYVGDNEAKSRKGTKQLVDSVGIESLSSFIYQNKIFYLVSKKNETLITTIKNKKFVTLDKMSDFSMWSYNPINRRYPEETIYSFSNYDSSGFIRIKGNKLILYSFDWKHK